MLFYDLTVLYVKENNRRDGEAQRKSSILISASVAKNNDYLYSAEYGFT